VSADSRALRRDLVGAARLLILPVAAFAFVLAFVPGRAGLAIRIFALVLCGMGVVLMVAVLRRAFPPADPLRPPERHRKEPRSVPETLVRMEARTALGVAGAFDLHFRLRPRLRRLADELLASRRGIALDAEPERAKEALGDETWEVVRADRPAPTDRLARGIPIPELKRVVESLENL
jgi:hypothetical protein